jgi:uncharacterized protein YceK
MTKLFLEVFMKKVVKQISLVLLFAILIVSMTGCATILSSDSKDITFESSPPGAEIKINGVTYAKTPTTIPLDKSHSYTVEITKEGYQPFTATIKNKIGVGWVILDLISGAMPIVVDAITGDWKTLSPTKIYVNLATL